ncbi:MAG: Bro-N domain-containing protein [Clostridiales bacterium]|nr:Bro-N domain-containing protein [Clostridiales bacterium]
MTDLQIFNNDQFGQIRTAVKDGEPLFVAADVCRALEIQNHKNAIKRLDDDEKSGVVLTAPHGRPQETNCVTESGLYSLVLGSRKPEAKAFKRWITHDVIPAIRKTGGYVDNEQQFVETYLPFADANTKALFGQTFAQLRAANEQFESAQQLHIGISEKFL